MHVLSCRKHSTYNDRGLYLTMTQITIMLKSEVIKVRRSVVFSTAKKVRKNSNFEVGKTKVFEQG